MNLTKDDFGEIPTVEIPALKGAGMRASDHGHLWHVAVNKFSTEKMGTDEWPRFMYEAMRLAEEAVRLRYLFAAEREGKLPKHHCQCKTCAPKEIPVHDNHLTCCLGVECRKCPHLLALDAAGLPPKALDQAKAWTCCAHIICKGGDFANEGYILTTDDRMYWDRVYENLAAGIDMNEPIDLTKLARKCAKELYEAADCLPSEAIILAALQQVADEGRAERVRQELDEARKALDFIQAVLETGGPKWVVLQKVKAALASAPQPERKE